MVEEFLVDRAVYCAPDTLRFYRESLRLFCNWGSEFGYTYPQDMDVNMVKQYCIYLREQRKIKATSIKTNFHVPLPQLAFSRGPMSGQPNHKMPPVRPVTNAYMLQPQSLHWANHFCPFALAGKKGQI